MKPCPFCGSYEIGLDTNINGDQAVICTSCYAAGPGAEIGEDALAAWDDRAAVNHADALAALLFRVRGELAAGGALWLLEEVDTVLAAYAAAKEAQP